MQVSSCWNTRPSEQWIAVCTHELEEHLSEIRKRLKKPTLQYITVAGVDVSASSPSCVSFAALSDLRQFLIEMRLKEAVPDNWVKMSS
jgi:hypothetical protein